jgi:hypothetical protein
MFPVVTVVAQDFLSGTVYRKSIFPTVPLTRALLYRFKCREEIPNLLGKDLVVLTSFIGAFAAAEAALGI